MGGACCSSAPHLHPTRHPLTSSLEKEGSIFVMDSICLFPIPTVGNMETKPPSHFLFHSTLPLPPHALAPSFPLHTINWALYDIIYLWMVRWEWDAADADVFFFLLASDVLFFRRKSNWSVTLCTTFGNTTADCDAGHHFSQTYFYAFLCGFRHIKNYSACQPDGGLLGHFLICLWCFLFVSLF